MRETDAAQGRTGEVLRADMQRRVPLGRRLTPEEIAAPIVFLASPAAAAIVGHVLVIDGGQTIF
jgi:NAD(P)-dependent dehydrogenase (short-subunit alcohol dehydrogenase family)